MIRGEENKEKRRGMRVLLGGFIARNNQKIKLAQTLS